MPRLRFDKVALRLTQGVRGKLERAVPDGLCVVFAVTAPIREPVKTAAALIEAIQLRLSLRIVPDDYAAELHGNRVQVRIVRSRSPHDGRVAGFVHSPGPRSNVLLDLAVMMRLSDRVPDAAVIDAHGVLAGREMARALGMPTILDELCDPVDVLEA